MRRLNDGEVEKRRRQVKIINNNVMDINCPRSNSNAVVVMRRSPPPGPWFGTEAVETIKIIKRKSRRNCLSGFFQTQLRMMKMKQGKLSSSTKIIVIKHNKKKKKKKGKLSSFSKSCVDNQIIIDSKSLVNYEFGTSYPILKRHRRSDIIDLKKDRDRLSELPRELLAHILVRLPVKYILRCRCLVKSLNHFIKSPVFVTLHLNYQKQHQQNHNHNYPKYLFFQFCQDFNLTVRIDDVQCQEYCRLEFLPDFPGYAWFALSYGLVCASTMFLVGPAYDRNIYLWNPLINKYKSLPDLPFPSRPRWPGWEALAFGFLPEINDYVVIHIIKPCSLPHPHSVIIGVYSLNTNSWKKLSQDNVFISQICRYHEDVVFINGAAFWVGFNSDRQKILMCFDTKTDILSEISLPDSVAYLPFVPVIHAFGQSIAYFIWEGEVFHFDMWVLKYDDYINEFTWEKKMCVTPSKHVGKDVLGIRNNGDPILKKREHLISYNLDSHQASRFVNSWESWTQDSPYNDVGESPYVIKPFVESLVMLNDD